MRTRARLGWPAAVVAVGVMVSSCASINIDALPISGSGYQSGGYDIVIEFSNVLNLPERAKVVMDGTKVGEVSNVDLTSTGTGTRVDVTARINDGILVPSNIDSVLQQATVLGDTYVALERTAGPEPAPPLRPGGRIPLAQTTSPPQLEDTIASMANFVGSGSIQRAQHTVININRVTPPLPEVRAMASRVAVDLSDLANNIDNVDQLLNGLSSTVDVMYTNTGNFRFWLSPEGVAGFRHNFLFSHVIAPLLPTLGTIYYNGHWLVPAVSAIGDALEAIQHSKWAFEEEAPRWRRLYTDYFLPERKYPAINITQIVGPDGRDLTGNVDQVLRMIGAMP